MIYNIVEADISFIYLKPIYHKYFFYKNKLAISNNLILDIAYYYQTLPYFEKELIINSLMLARFFLKEIKKRNKDLNRDLKITNK